MNFLSVAEVAKLWSMSERSVRNYCAEGRIPGAILVGKTWMIPSNAAKPNRKARTSNSKKTLLYILKLEKESKLKGGIYHKVQIELTYNSNHIEGSCLTHDQTRYIYETNTIGLTNEVKHLVNNPKVLKNMQNNMAKNDNRDAMDKLYILCTDLLK